MSSAADINEQNDAFKTLSNLFGVRWDKILQWIVIGYASTWFWVKGVNYADGGAIPSEQGPIGWLVVLLRSVDIGTPNWLVQVPAWLVAPGHQWLVSILPVVAAVAATVLVRMQESSGLVIASVLALLLAVQAQAGLQPALIAALLSIIPAAGAMLVAYRQSRQRRDVDGHFIAEIIIRDFLLVTLTPIWQPLFAPLIAAALLVGAYGKQPHADNVAADLVSERISALVRSDARLADARAADVVAALAGALMVPTQDRRWGASSVRFAFEVARGARSVRPRDE
jgi:hypothetical protein